MCIHTLVCISGSLTETNNVARICKDCVTNQFYKNFKCVVMVNSKWMVNCVGGGKTKNDGCSNYSITADSVALHLKQDERSGRPEINVMLRDNK